jgi:ATP synthase protein I
MRQINAKLRIPSKPIRTVLRWQLIATAVLAVAAGMLAGAHGALSAALGGTISVCAGWMSAVVATRGRDASAGGVLLTAFKAEGVKLGVLALLSWLVLRTYAEVVVAVFLGSLVATVLIFSMAFFVREHDKKS